MALGARARRFYAAILGLLLLSTAIYLHYRAVLEDLAGIVYHEELVCDSIVEIKMSTGSASGVVVEAYCLPWGTQASMVLDGVYVCPPDARGVKVRATTVTGFPSIEVVYTCTPSR